MDISIIRTIMMPLLGTSLGAAGVMFLHDRMDWRVEMGMNGFAAGVMVAASIWSLLIPSIDQSRSLGQWAFVPAVVGFWIGTFFMLFIDRIVPHIHGEQTEGMQGKHLNHSTMLMLAVTIHNIPEGMALGVVVAGWLSGNVTISEGNTVALALGLAIQNFPEGAIVSLPMHAAGMPRKKALGYGILSGVVEPVASVATIFLASSMIPLLPYFLSFAAGVMIYVVVEELIPGTINDVHSNIGVLAFAVGFTLMMVLEMTLG
ncbi:MAG: ZIP family metal transporter [Peptoniphilus sp.]|nr:ZIP family metal transporter [Peptoniphilus sp.]MDD7363191.1 ZIP family metal transporter [Bacillota bacterium]MDY6044485.1 ZIP family metal transporter [Peptoniphilus sp.]